MNNSKSEETIYDSVIPLKNRCSSSSEDMNELDSSDEFLNSQLHCMQVIDNSIVENARSASSRRSRESERDRMRASGCSPPRPSTSSEGYRPRPRPPTPEERVNEILKGAEVAKARILPKPGKAANTAVIDETYIVVGSHLDPGTIDKKGGLCGF